ncbi:metallophosphoesterase [Pseudohoeflea suaedae]|uniref:Metallophosphoesterase n=1 Tax=Pseudohoeflea suaedae TaxID=877384 RepID=A0A4R5PJX1_9HYPH|nr:metallophosphoesterase [Pseudohoeflea suaedae]TDH35110.1 metallophosphoesterase [Pseudohoeflea suaedae]
MITRRDLLKLLGAGFVTLAATAAYPFTEVFGKPRVTEYRLSPRGWPMDLKLRAAVIADIHACEPWMTASRIEAICRQTTELDPDIILLLGDYVSGTKFVTRTVEASEWSAVLGTLRAPLGVHAILGNHDYLHDRPWHRDPSVAPSVLEALQRVGISTYVNEAVPIHKEGARFWLAGLGDQLASPPGLSHDRPGKRGIDDLDMTLAGIPEGEPVILMAHEPDIFPPTDDRVSLTVSGHTHGGQFNLFGWRPVSASRASAKYPAGYFNVGGSELIVSRGLGCSVLPLRVGSYPEILLLELG